MFGGTEPARKFISANEADWKWWSTSNTLIRPQVAITIISSDDRFETGKPDKGVAIRVRCRWNSMRQTLKSPAIVLEKLVVDGKTVNTEENVIKSRRGVISDAYFIYQWGQPANGIHQIEATVKDVRTNVSRSYKKVFIQN